MAKKNDSKKNSNPSSKTGHSDSGPAKPSGQASKKKTTSTSALYMGGIVLLESIPYDAFAG